MHELEDESWDSAVEGASDHLQHGSCLPVLARIPRADVLRALT